MLAFWASGLRAHLRVLNASLLTLLTLFGLLVLVPSPFSPILKYGSAVYPFPCNLRVASAHREVSRGWYAVLVLFLQHHQAPWCPLRSSAAVVVAEVCQLLPGFPQGNEKM